MPDCSTVQGDSSISCSSNTGIYFAVGIIVPISLVIIIFIIFVIMRYRKKRREQQASMTTLTSVSNPGEQQDSSGYQFPPQYTAIINNMYDKPPSYEQTVHYLNDTNQAIDDRTTIVAAAATALPTTPPIPTARRSI